MLSSRLTRAPIDADNIQSLAITEKAVVYTVTDGPYYGRDGRFKPQVHVFAFKDIAENYVQEGARKRAAISRPATWHLIGGLQRNKVRSALQAFDWVHSVDSARLGLAPRPRLRCAPRRRLPVLIQVNLSGAPGQRGATAEGWRLRGPRRESRPVRAGLMTIALGGAPADVLRDHFEGWSCASRRPASWG
jgi:uncharacterized pyridoxal phosphate-containing UPF0001 family protein